MPAARAELIFPVLLLATVPVASFFIGGAKSAPAAAGKLTRLHNLPPSQTHLVFLLQNSTHALTSSCNENSEFTLPIMDASVEWTQPMLQGTYLLQSWPALSCAWPQTRTCEPHVGESTDLAFAP